jgi:hypothetical protein
MLPQGRHRIHHLGHLVAPLHHRQGARVVIARHGVQHLHRGAQGVEQAALEVAAIRPSSSSVAAVTLPVTARAQRASTASRHRRADLRQQLVTQRDDGVHARHIGLCESRRVRARAASRARRPATASAKSSPLEK